MKKKYFFIVILVLVSFCFKNNVYASKILDYESNYNYILDVSAVDALSCSNENVMKVLKLFSVLFIILKVAIPLIIVILGIISLVKVIISDDQNMLSNAISSLIKRFIIGVFIFFIPTLISTIIGYIDDADNVTSEYRACTECLLNSNCTGASIDSMTEESHDSITNNTTTTIDVD